MSAGANAWNDVLSLSMVSNMGLTCIVYVVFACGLDLNGGTSTACTCSDRVVFTRTLKCALLIYFSSGQLSSMKVHMCRYTMYMCTNESFALHHHTHYIHVYIHV